MPKEIERKFLVDTEAWRGRAERSKRLRQAYLASTGAAAIRVRIVDSESAFLTIKSASPGMSRDEFEYEIPVTDAEAMLALRTGEVIEKTRHVLPCDDGDLTVDEFHGSNDGLVMAEIELAAEDVVPSLPEWIGPEITHDKRFYNASLAQCPYCGWPREKRAPIAGPAGSA